MRYGKEKQDWKIQPGSQRWKIPLSQLRYSKAKRTGMGNAYMEMD